MGMLSNDVSDVTKWLGTPQWSYIEHIAILKKSKKIHFFQEFSDFQADFLKDLLIKVVVADKKIIFSKIKDPNQKSGF